MGAKVAHLVQTRCMSPLPSLLLRGLVDMSLLLYMLPPRSHQPGPAFAWMNEGTTFGQDSRRGGQIEVSIVQIRWNKDRSCQCVAAPKLTRSPTDRTGGTFQTLPCDPLLPRKHFTQKACVSGSRYGALTMLDGMRSSYLGDLVVVVRVVRAVTV